MDTTVAGLPIGHLLDGRYRVDARIARGGMATVYLGTDTRLERAVALKIAHAEFASDDGFVRRFIDEAKSVARLSSPNVVAVYDQGADGAILFLAMEYVPGQTLRTLLSQRVRLRPRESLDIIEGVLTGLAAAHESGIIHRDVKPENVLITPQGAVKVADFGLARAAARGAVHTQDGMIIGTAAYLAPEQVSASTSDARTDVYATGIMLFELLTGRQPHQGGTPLETAYKHVDEVVPPPSSYVHGLPPALDALVALATSRNPDRRPGDAGEFLRAIAGVRQGLPIADPAHGAGGGHAAGGTGHGAGVPPFGVGGPSSGAGGRYAPAGVGGPSSGAGGSHVPAGGARAAGGWAGPGAGPLPAGPVPAFPGSSPGQAGGAGADSWPDGASTGPGAGGAPAGRGPFDQSPWPPLVAGTGPGAPISSRGGGPGGSAGPASGGFPAVTMPPGSGPPPQALPADLVPPPAQPGGRLGRHSRNGPARKVEILPAVTTGAQAAVTGLGPVGVPGLLPAPVADPEAGMNHTLIVSDSQRDEVLAGGQGRGRGRWARRHEPFLSRWLFSRRLAYVGAALAIVLTATLVTWWVTAGQYTTVPHVVGMAKSTARQELRNLGFTVKNAPGVHSNTIQRGQVASTEPAIGSKIRKGGTITLIGSLGPVLIKVPPVSGKSLSDAQDALRKAGLEPGNVVKGASATIPAGTVLSTQPIAGRKQPQNEPVTIVVSAGPPLPSLVGEPLDQAQQQAQQLGFQLNTVVDHHSDMPANTITRQSPRPGDPINPGEVVTVRVSDGPPTVTVPNVTGLDVHQAVQILTENGFQVNIQQVGPGHQVFGEQPNGAVPKGATITLFIGFSL